MFTKLIICLVLLTLTGAGKAKGKKCKKNIAAFEKCLKNGYKPTNLKNCATSGKPTKKLVKRCKKMEKAASKCKYQCNAAVVAVDGGWTDFNAWSECSKTCGGGEQSRSRTCTNPAPENGGADCEGDEVETQTCNTDPCKGTIQGRGDCPTGYLLVPGDISGAGTKIGSKITVTSREDCAKRCSKIPECKSFEHSNTTALCNLNTDPLPFRGPHDDYAFCSSESCPAGYTLIAGDIGGRGNLGAIDGESREDCARMCSDNPECKSFEYDPTDVTCNLNKDPLPNRGQHWDQVFCTKEKCPKGYQLFAGDIPGRGTNIGSNIKVDSIEACAKRCSDIPECKSFEHANSTDACNLNTKELPTSGQHWDQKFCSKSELEQGCDCKLVNSRYWTATDVVYDITNATVTALKPSAVGSKTIRNSGSVAQDTTLSVSEEVTETKSFTHTAGVSVTVGASFTVGCPVVASGTVHASITASYEFSYGTERSETKTMTAEFSCHGPPGKKTVCNAMLYKDEVNVDYVMTWTKNSDTSCQCKEEGVFREILANRLEMDIEETPLERMKRESRGF